MIFKDNLPTEIYLKTLVINSGCAQTFQDGDLVSILENQPSFLDTCFFIGVVG